MIENNLFLNNSIRFKTDVKLLTNVQSIWQHGCIFSYEYSTAIIEEIEEKQMISIKVRVNENNCKLIGMINEIIEQLLNNYYRKRGGGQQHIPCPHCINENIKEPYIFSTNECEDNLLAGLHQVNCLQDLENPVPVDFRNIASDIILKDCDEYRIDYKDIVIQDKLGEGAYGILYKGTYNGSPVAIKVIRTEMVDSKDQLFTIFHEFKKEVLLMSELRHKNIVELKGFSIETNNIAMVMELMDQGDLYRLIQGIFINLFSFSLLSFPFSPSLLHFLSCLSLSLHSPSLFLSFIISSFYILSFYHSPATTPSLSKLLSIPLL